MTTVNTDMIIYNQLAQTAYLERLQDVIEIFNGSSNGAFILENELIQGDFSKRAFYKVGGSISHRDVNSTLPVTPNKIGSGEMVGVKCPWKYGPYASTDEAFKRRARTVEEFYQLMGVDMADAALDGYVEYAMAALPDLNPVPDEWREAGYEIAYEIRKGNIYADKQTGLLSKSSSAGEVSVSKTFASNATSFSKGKLIANDLLKPWLPNFGSVQLIRKV